MNRTKRVLDTNITFETSKHTVVSIPVLDESYLQESFTRNRILKTAINQGLTIKEYNF